MATPNPPLHSPISASSTATAATTTATASPSGSPGSQPVAASGSMAPSVGVGAQQHQQPRSLLHRLPLELNPLLFSCLDTRSLVQLHTSDREHRGSLASTMAEKKTVSEALLPHVFNANPKGIAEFFARSGVLPDALKKMILTKTYCREGYRNQKNEFIPTRHWGLVSPLQATARSGDNFILMQLLSILLTNEPSAQKIPGLQATEDEQLREEAVRQLLEVIKRVKAEPPVGTAQRFAATPAPGSVPTVGVASTTATPSPAPASATATAAPAAPSHAGGTDRKGAEENKEISESANIVFADAAPYLAPFIELIEAYKVLTALTSKFVKQENLNTIVSLWEKVGECQKKLPRYGLQEFCDDKPFAPIPTFDTAPNRACRYANENPLVLEDIGIGTRLGLDKSYTRRGAYRMEALIPGVAAIEATTGKAYVPHPWVARHSIEDLAAINRLCELRRIELGNIISALRTPETAQILVQTWIQTESLAFLRTPLSQPQPQGCSSLYRHGKGYWF